MNSRDSKTKPNEGREDLTGEHKWGDAGQLIFFIIFIAVWITDSFFTKTSNHLAENIPLFIRLIIAIPILVISFDMAKKGMNIVFGQPGSGSSVIREGYFSVVRHPIYLSVILLYFGLIISTLSLISVGIWIVIIGFYYFISKYEEKILIERFGDEYQNYMHDVPMLVPKFWK